MAEIFPLFRYFSVSSVIDKDNSHGDWREDIFYNGRNGNDRAARAEPSWLEFCRDVKEEDESQIKQKNGKNVCDLTIVFLHRDSAIQACLMAFAALSVLCFLCEIKSKNSISGIIMVIMIISFRTKTDYSLKRIHTKKEGATPDPSIRRGKPPLSLRLCV